MHDAGEDAERSNVMSDILTTIESDAEAIFKALTDPAILETIVLDVVERAVPPAGDKILFNFETGFSAGVGQLLSEFASLGITTGPGITLLTNVKATVDAKLVPPAGST